MIQYNVRISEIELKGFKNIQYGRIEMPSTTEIKFNPNQGDILGIYGQNGSGKTAVIEAMDFIQTLLAGESLPVDTVQYISQETGICTLTVKFFIKADEKEAMVDYSVQLRKNPDHLFEIARETLSVASWIGEKIERKKTLFDFSSNNEGVIFTPKYRYEELVRNNKENKVNLMVAKKIAQKNLSSFIFNSESRSILLSAPQEILAEYDYILQALYEYSQLDLIVITNDHSGMISMNLLIPLAIRMEIGEKIAKGDLPIRLDGPSVIKEEEFLIVKEILDDMNRVLGAMVPDLSVEIHDFGEQLLENGSAGHKVELVSNHGAITIPLRYESEGIKKIISVLNVLMRAYNDPSTCLLIDELDSGISEYLLGELLLVFEKGAKGQLIFTSHNLRPLEMLNKNSIIFSTTNPKNRYIHLKNVKTNNNLRDMYLRSILLGGQKEEIYDETDSVEIGRAFRHAGKAKQNATQE